MVNKTNIRKNVLYKRNQISKKEWETNSNIIYKKVVTHSFFLEADNILCFVNYQTEVETRNIIRKAWELGKAVFVPRIEEGRMLFYQPRSLEELTEGYKGIPEPLGKDLFVEQDGLVIVPGVAFDRYRNRIGYGKGFYDRFLQEHPDMRTIAIAFEQQVLDMVPNDEFDIRPEVLITEENNYDSEFTK